MPRTHHHSAALRSADDAIVQDFLLTKTMLLLARNAQAAEWRFEYDAIHAASMRDWERNHFLLDYTLARALSVLNPAISATTDAFLDGFTAAVRREDFPAARAGWLSLQAHVSSTVRLIAALTVEPRSPAQVCLLETLPDPYSEAAPPDTSG